MRPELEDVEVQRAISDLLNLLDCLDPCGPRVIYIHKARLVLLSLLGPVEPPDLTPDAER